MQRRTALLALLGSLLYCAAFGPGNSPGFAQQTAGDQAGSGPHIALLLPLKSGPFARLAEAVRRGAWEAHRVHAGGGLPLVVYSTSDDAFDIMQTYQKAVAQGAQLVIGPLTRSAVSALANSTMVSVPTLALNAPEGDAPLPSYLYVFGLQVENEAKQVAALAAQQGRRRALVVSARTGLSKRLSQAFTEEWLRRGNEVSEEFSYTSDAAELGKLRDMLAVASSDMVFLALDGQQSKLMRSYLGLSMPIYATSLVNASSDALAHLELNGVIFVDMPWLLLPDHPAVLSYARPDSAAADLEFQRFYALGIDAYRIAQGLIGPRADAAPLDGVTGTIIVDRERRVLREPVVAQFTQGETKILFDEQSR
jgi:outer membrane PBP1 activator LpoA protein